MWQGPDFLLPSLSQVGDNTDVGLSEVLRTSGANKDEGEPNGVDDGDPATAKKFCMM
jgi:hypothetical protein